jgi:uncharacterized protein with GYD domain
MPIYITRVSLTQKGVETLKDAPKRTGQVREWIQKAGGRVVGAYATLGENDYLWITEFPDSNAAWSVLTKVAQMGTSRSNTVEAILIEDFFKIVGQP